MLKPEDLETLPPEEMTAEALARRGDPAVVRDSAGEPVGVLLPVEWYENYRRLLKADEFPEGVLDPIPMDAKGRPVGLTTHQLVRRLERVARETAEEGPA